MTEANTTKQTTPADRLVIMRVGALHRALELMINQAIRSASDERPDEVDAVLFDIMSLASVVLLTIEKYLKDTEVQASPAG